MKPSAAFISLLVWVSFGCVGEATVEEKSSPEPERPQAVAGTSMTTSMIPSPAADGSGEPFLSRSYRDDAILMSWIEKKKDEDRATVRLARLDPRTGSWSTPSSVVTASTLFVNWADFPSVVQTADGTLFAHYLEKSGEGKYSYDVKVVRSGDEGVTWSKPVILHGDGVSAEHGFVSIVPESRDAVHLVWLDGRKMTGSHEGHGEMSLRHRMMKSDGSLTEETELDDRICECCQTGMAMGTGGPVVVYRDRSAEEIRDIGLVRRTGSSWTKPTLLHSDDWKIAGCPVNGPQIDARGDDLVAAWFTSGGGKANVKVKFSGDSGASWSAPVIVDGGQPMGRVDVSFLDDGRALVVWIEQVGQNAEVRGRVVSKDGSAGEAFAVAPTTTSRSAGFPRIAVSGDSAYAAWTQTGDVPVIRVAKISKGSR